ncbi:MAG: helix-turn-helix domain-containing protein [Saprospiraceae bacterium]|nr:helix-turn-helix domain-containing protein [Saprospiraceae bacterium]
METKIWLTEEETQEYLGMKRTTLWKLRKQGVIHHSMIGNKVYYHKPSIEELLFQNSTLR